MREHAPVALHENGVPWHSHIWLEIAGRLTRRVLQAEGENRQLLRPESLTIADPDDASSVRCPADTVCRRARAAPLTVIACQRDSANRRCVELTSDCLRDAGPVHEIAKQLVVTLGQV